MRYGGLASSGGVIEMFVPGGSRSRRARASFAEMNRQSGSRATAIGTGARATMFASAWRCARNSSGFAWSGGSNNIARLDIRNPGEGCVLCAQKPDAHEGVHAKVQLPANARLGAGGDAGTNCRSYAPSRRE